MCKNIHLKTKENGVVDNSVYNTAGVTLCHIKAGPFGDI